MNESYRIWGRKLGSSSELPSLPAAGILARCLYGEARGATPDEMQKVGAVVRNRVQWWRKSWAGVILQPYRFSWTLKNDPNLPKVLNPMAYEDALVWERCCLTAEGIVENSIPDGTKGADHYFDRSMDANPPVWIRDRGMVATVRTGRFRFYRSARVKA